MRTSTSGIRARRRGGARRWRGSSVGGPPGAASLGGSPAPSLGVGRRVFPGAIREFVGRPETALLPYRPGDHARDCAGWPVDTVVHVEAGWIERGPLGPVGETRWVDAL